MKQMDNKNQIFIKYNLKITFKVRQISSME